MHQISATTSKIAQIFHYGVASGKISKEMLSQLISQANAFTSTISVKKGDDTGIKESAQLFVSFINKNAASALDEDTKEDLWEFIQASAESSGLKSTAIEFSAIG